MCGRRRHIWVSTSSDLKFDAERDLYDVLGKDIEVGQPKGQPEAERGEEGLKRRRRERGEEEGREEVVLRRGWGRRARKRSGRGSQLRRLQFLGLSFPSSASLVRSADLSPPRPCLRSTP